MGSQDWLRVDGRFMVKYCAKGLSVYWTVWCTWMCQEVRINGFVRIYSFVGNTHPKKMWYFPKFLPQKIPVALVVLLSLPETNSLPLVCENGWLEDDSFLLGVWPILRCFGGPSLMPRIFDNSSLDRCNLTLMVRGHWEVGWWLVGCGPPIPNVGPHMGNSSPTKRWVFYGWHNFQEFPSENTSQILWGPHVR